MATCGKCGKDVPAGTGKCPSCGAPVMAVLTVKKGAQKQAENIPMRLKLARTALDQKDFQVALRHTDEIITKEPKNVDAHRLRAQVLEKLKNREEMLKELDNVISLALSSADGHREKGAAQVRLGRAAD
jgi:Tfp pilus assembly protein PilF